jgi:hypothetical protein
MELIPGFLQGVTRVLISYPFDYVRTNLQTKNVQSTGLFNYVKNHNLSLRDAYRGCSIMLVSVPIDRSIQFLLFERFLKNHSVFTSSIVSSLISSVYSVPMNFMSTLIITQHKSFTKESLWKFVNDKKYYTGYGADLGKSFAGSVLYTSIYGSLRQSIPKEQHNYFVFGVASSIGSWCFIYPLDTIRVLKQTSQLSYLDILKTTPIHKFYSGFSIILMRSIPSAGFGMLVYEKSRQLLLS